MEIVTFGILAGFAIVIVGKFLDRSDIGKDATDPPYGRSGLRLYTDSETGVQYVGTCHGLTPRLDANGAPMRKE